MYTKKNSRKIFTFWTKNILLSVFIYFIFSLNLYAADTSYNKDNNFFSFGLEGYFFYRTCEVIEITGNEDTMNMVLFPVFYYSFIQGNFVLGLDLSFSLSIPSSDKYRYYDLLGIPFFSYKEVFLTIGFSDVLSLLSGYRQNPVLHFHFQNWNPPAVQNTPAYPLDTYDNPNQHSYFAFVLGDRMLPLYYANSAHLYDTLFTFQWDFISNEKLNLSLLSGITNGEDGLDSNSAKSVYLSLYVRTGSFLLWDSVFPTQSNVNKQNKNDEYTNNFLFSLSGLIGNRGSVPTKVYNHQYTAYIEYCYRKDNFSFTFSLEGYLTLHGFTKSYINPYDASYYNYPDQIDPEWASFINLYLYLYGNGFLLPDDLPNLDNPGEYLVGSGGFVYLGLSFGERLDLFFHFSLYDSNVLSDAYIIYRLKWKIAGGVEFRLIKNLSFLFSFSYQYDPVFLNYIQFYEAENRDSHAMIDYDLFFSIKFNFF